MSGHGEARAIHYTDSIYAYVHAVQRFIFSDPFDLNKTTDRKILKSNLTDPPQTECSRITPCPLPCLYTRFYAIGAYWCYPVAYF